MSISQTGICNLALIEVGGERISAISEDTRPAQLLNAIWEISRKQFLRDHPWKTARKRTTLSPVSTAPEFEWDYAYDYPNDMIKPLFTYTDDIPWVSENNQILSNESELDMVYTYDHEDYEKWPADMAEAFALKLGAQVAYALTQSLSLRESLEKRYVRKLALARSASGSEGDITGIQADDWTNRRR